MYDILQNFYENPSSTRVMSWRKFAFDTRKCALPILTNSNFDATFLPDIVELDTIDVNLDLHQTDIREPLAPPSKHRGQKKDNAASEPFEDYIFAGIE